MPNAPALPAINSSFTTGAPKALPPWYQRIGADLGLVETPVKPGKPAGIRG
jgi:hypothetical protein